MKITRRFLLNVNSGQYEMLPASKDDSIPASDVPPKDILLYDQCSIWDVRLEISHSQTIWNQTPNNAIAVHDDRTLRLSQFMNTRKNLQPEWGRNANDGAQVTQEEDIAMGW